MRDIACSIKAILRKSTTPTATTTNSRQPESSSLYLSYNVTPGWSLGIPLRILMAEYAKREASGALVDRINGSLEFVDSVMEAGAGSRLHRKHRGTDGGQGIGRIEQLFIKAMADKQNDPIDWVFKLLASQGQSLIVNGEIVQGEEANRTELKRMFEEFKTLRDPVLRCVGVY